MIRFLQSNWQLAPHTAPPSPFWALRGGSNACEFKSAPSLSAPATTPHQHPPRSSFLYASAVQACADFFSRFGVGRAHAPAPAAPSPSGTGPARWGARAPPDAARRRPAAAEAEWAGLDVEDMGPEALPAARPAAAAAADPPARPPGGGLRARPPLWSLPPPRRPPGGGGVALDLRDVGLRPGLNCAHAAFAVAEVRTAPPPAARAGTRICGLLADQAGRRRRRPGRDTGP
jgi:hypothetical protein